MQLRMIPLCSAVILPLNKVASGNSVWLRSDRSAWWMIILFLSWLKLGMLINVNRIKKYNVLKSIFFFKFKQNMRSSIWLKKKLWVIPTAWWVVACQLTVKIVWVGLFFLTFLNASQFLGFQNSWYEICLGTQAVCW